MDKAGRPLERAHDGLDPRSAERIIENMENEQHPADLPATGPSRDQLIEQLHHELVDFGIASGQSQKVARIAVLLTRILRWQRAEDQLADQVAKSEHRIPPELRAPIDLDKALAEGTAMMNDRFGEMPTLGGVPLEAFPALAEAKPKGIKAKLVDGLARAMESAASKLPKE